MLVLVLDTATPAVTAGLVSDGVVVAERVTVDARAHGELLAPAISDCLASVGATPADLGAIVAGVGPGPYTGLRVGLVTAAAMGHALAIPTYGVGTLDALGLGSVGRVLVATDARRKEIYFGVYADGLPVGEPSVAKAAAVTGGFTAALGAGAVLYAEALGVPVLAGPLYPPVAALAALAAERVESGAPGEVLVPLYLRRPDAVPLPGR